MPKLGGKVKPYGDFAMVDAIDVEMEDGSRLPEAMAGKADVIETQTSLPEGGIVSPNIMYFLGTVTAVQVGFPASAKLGDMIYLSFAAGNTAVALTITTTNHAGLEQLLMLANHIYELIGVWNGSTWVFAMSEVQIGVT